LINDITTVRQSVIAIKLLSLYSLGHEPGDVFCIRDGCLTLQSNLTNGEDLFRSVCE